MTETLGRRRRRRFGESAAIAMNLVALLVIIGSVPALDDSPWWWLALGRALTVVFLTCLAIWLGYVARDWLRDRRSAQARHPTSGES